MALRHGFGFVQDACGSAAPESAGVSGGTGSLTPDAATLRRVHRAWLAKVPYENLDIQLGRPISLTPEALIDKLGTRRRGGYCYEMNGALALLLREIGFDVTIVEGGVERETRGDEAWRNHMPLLVTLPNGVWLADAGLGDGFLEPLPLRDGSYAQGVFTYRVERLDELTWRVHNHPDCSVPSFDLRTTPLTMDDFVEKCRWQSTSPESGFVRSLVLGKPYADHAVVLRGRTLRHYGPAIGGKRERVMDTPEEFAETLATEFAVPLADVDIAHLWERAGEQHAQHLARKATKEKNEPPAPATATGSAAPPAPGR